MRTLSPDMLGLLVSMALTFGALLYRAGKRQAHLDNMKSSLTLEVRTLRDNHNQRFDRVDQRFDSTDQQLAAMQEQRAASEHWKGRVESTLSGHEQRLAQLEGGR